MGNTRRASMLSLLNELLSGMHASQSPLSVEVHHVLPLFHPMPLRDRIAAWRHSIDARLLDARIRFLHRIPLPEASGVRSGEGRWVSSIWSTRMKRWSKAADQSVKWQCINSGKHETHSLVSMSDGLLFGLAPVSGCMTGSLLIFRTCCLKPSG